MNANDLRAILEVLDVVINSGFPAKSERELTDLRMRVAKHLSSRGPERGEKVLEWRIPLVREFVASRGKNKGKVQRKKCVPTMNEMINMNVWAKQEVREWQEQHLLDALKSWPKASIQDDPRPRAVIVTRYSSKEPDELAADTVGGKGPIDRLVEAGVLAGDARKDLHRETRWSIAPKNEGYLLIEVHEVK